mmetsp:Transcript_48877/g.72956  ORF Transcript_48877/g.72956 Transcript_48877/m.72956 type:complete len:151 (+) Transcript_48877:211-663(+)
MASAEGGVPRFADPQNLGFREGLIIVAAIVALLIGLLVARFACHVLIDVCVMCDLDAARMTAIQWKDMICPCFRQRLVNPSASDADVEQEQGANQPRSEAVELSTLDSTLSLLPHGNKRAVLKLILPEKVRRCSLGALSSRDLLRLSFEI